MGRIIDYSQRIVKIFFSGELRGVKVLGQFCMLKLVTFHNGAEAHR